MFELCDWSLKIEDVKITPVFYRELHHHKNDTKYFFKHGINLPLLLRVVHKIAIIKTNDNKN